MKFKLYKKLIIFSLLLTGLNVFAKEDEVKIDTIKDKKNENVKLTDGAYAFKKRGKFDINDYKNVDKRFELKDYLKLEKEDKNIYILFYIHKKTKAPIYFLVFDKVEDLDCFANQIFFKASDFSKPGVLHMLEHFFYAYMNNFHKDYKLNGSNFYNAITSIYGLTMFIKSDQCSPYNFKRMVDSLKNRNIVKIVGKKLEGEIYKPININGKEKDRGRIFFEFLNTNRTVALEDGGTVKTRKKDVNYVLGKENDIKNFNLDYLEEVRKQVIHPSNSITVLSCLNDPKILNEYLEILKDWFDDGYKYKKCKISDDYKDFAKKIENEDTKYYYKNSKGKTFLYNGEKIKYSFAADLEYKVPITDKIKSKRFNIKDRDLFDLLSCKSLMDVLGREEIEKLGYKGIFIDIERNPYGDDILKLTFYGDEEEKFTKDKLKESAKDILDKFTEKISSNYNDLGKLYYIFSDKGKKEENLIEIKNNSKDGYLYRSTKPLVQLIVYNYINYNDPFSTNTMDIEEDKGTKKVIDKIEKVKENIKDRKGELYKLGILAQSINDSNFLRHTSYKELDCSSKDVDKKIEAYEDSKKIRVYFKNPTDDRLLFHFLSYVFKEKILNDLMASGYIYAKPALTTSPNSPYQFIDVKEAKDILKAYFKNKLLKEERNFSTDLEKFKLKEEDYKDLFNSYVIQVKRFYAEMEMLDKYYEKCKKLSKSSIDAITNINELKELGEIFSRRCFYLGSSNLFKNEKHFKRKKKQFEKFYEIYKKNISTLFSDYKSEKEKNESMQKIKDALKKIKKPFDKLYESCKKDIETILKRIEENDEAYSLENIEKNIKKMKFEKIEEGKEKDEKKEKEEEKEEEKEKN